MPPDRAKGARPSARRDKTSPGGPDSEGGGRSRLATSMRVAAVQMKFSPTIAGNLSKIAAVLGRLKGRKVDAVLFPECAVTGYSYAFSKLRPGEIREAIAIIGGLAREIRSNVLVGTPLFAGSTLYNALVVLDRDGKPIHCYAKCQLTAFDRKVFAPGNAVSLFDLDGVPCTSIICHERRYPELVRLAAMAGARVVFHPNAGLDPLSLSRTERQGQDGIPIRAFENAIYYVFANSVGPQGGGLWSAGDSKIVAPDGSRLALGDNEHESVVMGDLDLVRATRSYARDSLEHPRFLSRHWSRMLRELRARARDSMGHFGLS